MEGVVAGESEICFIDGDEGVLSYRGYNIHTLADNAVFEETIFLLWNGKLPKQAELDQLKRDLAAERGLPGAVVEFLKTVPKANAMDVLRTAVSMLSLHDPEAQDMSVEANHRKAVRLMSKTATIVTTFDRLRGGKPLLWKTGHSLIKAKMKETGALLAGEMSGHTFFSERWYGFDDGLYAGARLLEILSRSADPSAVLQALPDSVLCLTCAASERRLQPRRRR